MRRYFSNESGSKAHFSVVNRAFADLMNPNFINLLRVLGT